ncbi:MAG: hypothetical protein DRK00_00445 [Thermoprotei archaeon]|nr:MAG: hypothetical protein DRK00_00445 [Thermoprotei archaeon]
MPYYALLEPTGDESYDLFLLYKARKYKSFFHGTYYLPKRRELRPVFRIPHEVRDDVFEVIPASELEDSYKMLCVACGRCCALNSGAFAFEDELLRISEKLGVPPAFPSREVVVRRVGRLRVYELGVERGGRCYFYRGEGCMVEREGSWRLKPIICLIHFCSLFAERRGKFYIKVGVKRLEGRFLPIYREVSPSELERIVEEARRRVRRLYVRSLSS